MKITSKQRNLKTMVALVGALGLGLVGTTTARAQEATPNPSPTTEATRSPKDWSANTVIGTRLDDKGKFAGNDGRMISPQNQTQSPFSPTSVIVEVGKTLPCSVEQATDMDHWVQKDNDGDSSNDNDYGEDYGDSGDGVNYTWNCTGGGFPTETVSSGSSATWTAPTTPGRYILSCVINDTPTPIDSPPETGGRDDGEVVRSVEVNVVRLRILWEGNDVTDKSQDTIVGKRISLTGVLEGADGLTSGVPIWSIPGKVIKDWIAGTYVLPYTIHLNPWDLYGQTIYFSWVNDGSKNVQAKVFVGDQELEVNAATTFNVLKPSAAIQVRTGTPTITDQSSTNGSIELSYGIVSPARAGVKFTGAVTIPPGFSGITQWVQVASPSRTRTRDGVTECISGTGLDSTYPYPSLLQPPDPLNPVTEDAPSTPLTNNITQAIVNDTFQMWLMFKPDGSGSVWVPLKIINWGWNAQATRTGTFWDVNVDRPQFTPNTPSVSDTEAYPDWNFVWTPQALTNGWQPCP